jgi:hypothetical protein
MRSSRFLHPLFGKSSANDRCLRQADLSETPRYSSRFGSKQFQPDRVLTLKRANTDENTYVLNTRAKSRPDWRLLASRAGHIRRSLFFARTLLLCAHAAGRVPFWFRITPSVARKGANVTQKGPASSRARQTGSSALSDSLKPVCFMCRSEHERNSDSSPIFEKNIFLTSLVPRHILTACSNVAEASASRGTKCSLIAERWSWPMETRAPPALSAFATSGIQCDRKRIFFIWIRRNPLKSPDSTK